MGFQRNTLKVNMCVSLYPSVWEINQRSKAMLNIAYSLNARANPTGSISTQT